ncbi:MAG: 3-hydroxybutyryl-CoA dehydrogenase [Candidatus Zixiibacteriota bacterium]
MNLDDIKKVTVIGSGTMGNGIAQVFAQNGYPVHLIDIDKTFLEKAMATMSGSMDRQIKKGVITDTDKQAALARIETSTDLRSARDSQLVIEAITESLQVKLDLFKKLADICSPDMILASNTSSLPITQLAATTHNPANFIGMHFMNPVPMMKLVELIRGIATSDHTCHVAVALAKRLGKVPVEANDYPGFIANRILMPLINEAIYAHMEGVGTIPAIDEVMKLGAGHPMGPFTLADFIGLDVCLAILEVMHDGLGDPKYRPCPLLRKMVQAGYLGRKTGRGFYNYQQ